MRERLRWSVGFHGGKMISKGKLYGRKTGDSSTMTKYNFDPDTANEEEKYQ